MTDRECHFAVHVAATGRATLTRPGNASAAVVSHAMRT